MKALATQKLKVSFSFFYSTCCFKEQYIQMSNFTLSLRRKVVYFNDYSIPISDKEKRST